MSPQKTKAQKKARKALNFLVGKVLEKAPGADPVRVRELIIETLSEPEDSNDGTS